MIESSESEGGEVGGCTCRQMSNGRNSSRRNGRGGGGGGQKQIAAAHRDVRGWDGSMPTLT